MESLKKIQIGSHSSVKRSKKETTPDINSKSIVLITSLSAGYKSFLIMSSLKNHVQLIGHVGDAPKVTELENGNKVVNFSLATNEYFKNKDGEKKTNTNWHNIVAWGRTAEIISMYVGKGKEIGIGGRLKNRSYESETGDKRYVTEVEANEVLLMGTPETKS